ncbi:MAG: DUF1015 domain-containing protein [Myxococcota bacterium]
MRLHPFRALHPRPEQAVDVASPPYDVVDTDEARSLAEGRPRSFLHVVRPEIDLPADADPYDPRVYDTGAANLRRLIDDGVLVRDEAEALWLYRLDWGDHHQIGFVGCAEVDDYAEGRIKRHEHTRKAKEDDRARHVDTLGAQTGPVFLTCRSREGLADIQQRLAQGEPTLDVPDMGGVRHRLWRVGDPQDIADVAAALSPIDAFYVADGHHRAASAWRTRELRRQRNPDAPEDAPFERFLCVVFPHDQLRILPYNRVVSDLYGFTEEAFLLEVGKRFAVSGPGADPEPPERHQFGMYVGGDWRRLEALEREADEDDPVARLDVALLQSRLLEPVLGIEDPRTDPRVDFVGGIRGTGELERRVDARGAGCAFAMYPTSIEELLDVADAGRVMPPKSTWFEPKLASGLVVHLLDE